MKCAGPADPDPSCVGVAEHGPALPRRRAERLPWLQPGLNQSLDLPGEVPGPNRPAAEIASRGDRHSGLYAILTLSSAISSRSVIADLLVSSVKRSIVVVAPKVSQECMTDSVETSVTPFAAIVAAMSASRANPCSRVSTPASAASLQFGQSRPVGRHRRAAGVHGGNDLPYLLRRPRGGASLRSVQVELHQIRAVVELTKRRRQQPVGVGDLDRQSGRQRALPWSARSPLPGCRGSRRDRASGP